MDSLIEVQRQTHEEIERLERGLYTLLSRPALSQQQKLTNEHHASQVLDRILARNVTLNALYEDQDRKSEVDNLTGNTLDEFYSRFDKLKAHHAKYPDAAATDAFEIELASLVDEPDWDDEDYDWAEEDEIALMFTGEEAFGKYVDLYTNHIAYCNLKDIGKRPNYNQYLDIFIDASKPDSEELLHSDLSSVTLQSKEYQVYINGLHTYLLSFTKKTRPLEDIDSQQREAELEFERKWNEGEIKEWTKQEKKKEANGEGEGIWCAACQKMYSKQTVYDAHLTSKKHIKAAARLENGDATPSNPNGPATNGTSKANGTANGTPEEGTGKESGPPSAALKTYLCTHLIKPLHNTITDTKTNVERRAALTAAEREAEQEEASRPPKASTLPPPPTDPTSVVEEEQEEEERIYNPLKLPLGWDGKPIPYWLYKLHGLGVEYRCEICSDAVYMGRKNFDRHFQESRHAFGMRALGLPNTRHFHEITGIQDALRLAEKLKGEGRHEIFELETMEELEDEEGNVYNKKTYEDLKKQGLI